MVGCGLYQIFFAGLGLGHPFSDQSDDVIRNQGVYYTGLLFQVQGLALPPVEHLLSHIFKHNNGGADMRLSFQKGSSVTRRMGKNDNQI